MLLAYRQTTSKELLGGYKVNNSWDPRGTVEPSEKTYKGSK
jgi:hypothetical protein